MLNFFKGIWQKNWKGKATLIFGALVLIGALAGVTYAVVTGEGDEGFLKTEAGKPYQWEISQLPLQCMYDDSVISDHLDTYNVARKVINDAVGQILIGPCLWWQIFSNSFPVKPVEGTFLLRIGKPPVSERDGVTVEDPFKAHPGGVTKPFLRPDGSGHIFGMMVWIDPTFEKGLNNRVWIHELGHVLGLDHDRLQGSIMYSKVITRPGKLSSRDIKMLKAAYVQ